MSNKNSDEIKQITEYIVHLLIEFVDEKESKCSLLNYENNEAERQG